MRDKKNPIMAGFTVPRNRSVTGGKVRLRRKRMADAHDDYKWQSDTELAKLDAAPPLSVPYPLYLLDYAYLLRDAAMNRYLAIDTLDGRHIGNCTCYDIDEEAGDAQVGIMIGERDYWDMGYGTDAMTALVGHIFRHTGLNRVYLKTLDWNLRAQKSFKKSGFTPCQTLRKNGYDFLIMELTRPQWEKRQGEGDRE